MPVNTKTVTGRRTLRFNSVEDAVRDAEMLAAADRAGTLKPLGNWTLGQACGHVAGWINFAFDGYPPSLRPPGWVKFILKMMKNKYLNGLPAGARIPKIEGGTLNTDVFETDEGLARFRAAMQRLAASAPSHPNPVFGLMTHDEWLRLNLRHAELHLSFFVPR